MATNPDDPEQGWGVFGRFGLADRDTSVIRSFTSIGLGGTGVIPSRPQDRFGVGYYYMYFNSTRFESILQEDDEHAFEAFYNVVLTPWVTLSANLQILDGGLLDADTAVIGGLRLRIGL